MAAALGPGAVAIYHVGSTAIPDMPAKPVIDILVEIIAQGPLML
ncbi:MAG: GrpB family protein [Planctomycetota bacterium]